MRRRRKEKKIEDMYSYSDNVHSAETKAEIQRTSSEEGCRTD